MARFALYLETGGRVRPQELAGNIICGDPDAGDRPPAMHARADALDMVTGAPA